MRNIKILLLMLLPLSFMAAGCDDDKEELFYVVKTDIEASPESTKGTIELSSADFSFTVGADWCTAVKNGSVITLEANGNTEFLTRTTQVVITSGPTTIKVPVSQPAMVLEAIDYVEELHFSHFGGTKTFSVFANVDYTVEVVGSPEWITAVVTDVANDIITVTVGGTEEVKRTATVRVVFGEKTYDINVFQFKYPPYEWLSGPAEMEFQRTWDGDGDRVTVPITLSENIYNETVTVTGTFNGVEATFLMNYFSGDKGSLTIYGNQVLGSYVDEDNPTVTYYNYIRVRAEGARNATGALSYYYSGIGSSLRDYPATAIILENGVLYTFYDNGTWPANQFYGPRYKQGLLLTRETSANKGDSAPSAIYETMLKITIFIPFQ